MKIYLGLILNYFKRQVSQIPNTYDSIHYMSFCCIVCEDGCCMETSKHHCIIVCKIPFY